MNAFNGDHLIWEEFTKLIERFNIDAIVETGTYMAQSTIDFASLGLPVYTTESRKTFYDEAVAALEAAATQAINESGYIFYVYPYFGDSPKILSELLPILLSKGKRIIFFLDAHWYNDNCLERELMILSKLDWNGNLPVILIHDMQVPGRDEFGFDVYNNRPYSFSWIRNYIEDIYGENGYLHHYNTGISEQATHNRGCLFIYPNNS